MISPVTDCTDSYANLMPRRIIASVKTQTRKNTNNLRKSTLVLWTVIFVKRFSGEWMWLENRMSPLVAANTSNLLVMCPDIFDMNLMWCRIYSDILSIFFFLQHLSIQFCAHWGRVEEVTIIANFMFRSLNKMNLQFNFFIFFSSVVQNVQSEGAKGGCYKRS